MIVFRSLPIATVCFINLNPYILCTVTERPTELLTVRVSAKRFTLFSKHGDDDIFK